MTPATYTRPAVALHWLVALGIFVAFPLGLYMHELPLSPTRLQLYSWHKWLGMTILALAMLRILWRLGHTPPPLTGVTPLEHRLAHWAHLALYALIVAVPLSGWLMSSAKGFSVVWFGVLPLPDLIGKDRALGETLEEVHEILNFVMAGLVMLHVAGALKHRFVDGETAFLRRMSFRR